MAKIVLTFEDNEDGSFKFDIDACGSEKKINPKDMTEAQIAAALAIQMILSSTDLNDDT